MTADQLGWIFRNMTTMVTDIDNICLFAGHNEAEGGPDDTIPTPRQYTIKTVDGVKTEDMPVPELRGSSGSTIAGRYFCHEFGAY